MVGANSEQPQQGAEEYETEHVHRVYQSIAPHFASTRFKPWPIVENFLRGLPHGSVGLDIGCGNGKYMAVNPNIYILGSDRSSNLVKIAAERQPHEALIADALDSPYPCCRFDFVISIAVIHHFSSNERRVSSIRNILSLLRPAIEHDFEKVGVALIYVWALEQKSSRRGWDENSDPDVLVPWVMQKKFTGLAEMTQHDASSSPSESTVTIYQRYYHLYRQGELEEDVIAAGGVVCESGYEKDNWWALIKPNTKG